MNFKKKSIILILMAQLCTINLFSAEINTDLGTTFEFAEQDASELMRSQALNNKDKLQKKYDQYRQDYKNKLDNIGPKIANKPTPAYRDNEFYIDSTYTNPKDIRDHRGVLLYPKGFKFNPLTYIKIPYKVVFLDGTRKNELQWAIDNNLTNLTGVRILLTDGKYRVAKQFFNHHVFFATDDIVKKFGINHTPSIAEQVGQKMLIKEYLVKVDGNNTIDESKYPSLIIDLLGENQKNKFTANSEEKIDFRDLNLTQEFNNIIKGDKQ
ncbi:hypothetical protein A9K75_06670 [Campylobacter fetus subsp. testudinum]|uniref:hypothetical protein n=1 Tax=Campylobacter fetus TaxID=196 RepID=UPI000818918E|nr:hypothetical protein [Campylobacter fetus]OCR99548.1 hypothetical protein A9K75_06670 [Campylobacter fetus subsp. testudinum]